MSWSTAGGCPPFSRASSAGRVARRCSASARAAEFKKAQVQLVDVIQEFVQVRTTLFAKKEQAAQKYIASLSFVTDIFRETTDSYPKTISNALQQLNQRLTPVLDKLQKFLAEVESIETTGLSKASEHFNSLSSRAEVLLEQLGKLETAIGAVSSRLGSAPEQLDHGLKLLAEKFSTSAESMTIRTGEALGELQSKISDSHNELRSAIATIKNDLSAIDQIVSHPGCYRTAARVRLRGAPSKPDAAT